MAERCACATTPPGVQHAVAVPLRKSLHLVMTVGAPSEGALGRRPVDAATSARSFTVAAAAQGGCLRKLDGMNELATTGGQVLAIGYALFVACATLLPPGADLWLLVFDPDKLTARFVGRSVVLGALIGGLLLAVLAWRRRHVWISRLSLPLLGYMAVCGTGLALLVLVSQPPRYLGRLGLGGLRDFAQDFNARHIIFYFGFSVVAAVAWRGRVSLPLMGVLLMGFGYCLELAQKFVPDRTFRITDLLSNGFGILLGLCWVYLYASLLGVRGSGLSRLGGLAGVGWRGKVAPGAAVQPRQS